MWVASSAGRDDTAIARVGLQRVARFRNGCNSIRFRIVADRRGARSSATVDRRRYDTRHAGYFDGEWERP